MRTLGHTMVTPHKVLQCVPPPHLKPRCRDLRLRLDLHVPSICLDHCWVSGRGLSKAEAKVQPGWAFRDIVGFFSNIDQQRLWRVLWRLGDPQLLAEVRTMFDKLGCDEGVPEGCAFTGRLANLYLLDVDARNQHTAVRYGDNWAVDDPDALRAQLADIGLVTKHRDTFVGPPKIHPSTPKAKTTAELATARN